MLNICDDCLRAHTERLGQQKRYLPVRCRGMVGFGRVEVNRPLVAYTGNPDDTCFNVDVESLGEDHDGVEIEWVDDIAEMREDLQRR